MNVDGKVALVTGASRGVGRGVAVALAEAGADVACAARSTEARPQPTPGTLDDTVRQVEQRGRRAVAIPTNLAVEDDVARMVRTTVDELGRLDVLVNNAAVTFVGDLDLPMRRYDLIMAINLRAPLIAIREAAPHLRAGGGAIVNVSSAAALFPYDGLMAYGMTKAALERMTIDVARQLRSDGVACNCFRIDVPVASEGFVANQPDLDHSDWEPVEVPAEGIIWMLRQPPDYTGQLESMAGLRAREGIMASRAPRPYTGFVPG